MSIQITNPATTPADAAAKAEQEAEFKRQFDELIGQGCQIVMQTGFQGLNQSLSKMMADAMKRYD